MKLGYLYLEEVNSGLLIILTFSVLQILKQ